MKTAVKVTLGVVLACALLVSCSPIILLGLDQARKDAGRSTIRMTEYADAAIGKPRDAIESEFGEPQNLEDAQEDLVDEILRASPESDDERSRCIYYGRRSRNPVPETGPAESLYQLSLIHI